ncbi:hypothetical protein [Streptomyces gardneri]|uniref:hypothetical protein n=1 Tax=Streptomyces gardneri TaxID=66892 RepID=UPI0035D968A6
MNLLASLLRTAVPLLAGWVLTVTGALGIDTDSTAVTGGITAAITLAYYILLRLAELGAARIGWEPARLVAGLLLGWARPPAYEKPAEARQVVVAIDGSVTTEAMRRLVRQNGGAE